MSRTDWMNGDGSDDEVAPEPPQFTFKKSPSPTPPIDVSQWSKPELFKRDFALASVSPYVPLADIPKALVPPPVPTTKCPDSPPPIIPSPATCPTRVTLKSCPATYDLWSQKPPKQETESPKKSVTWQDAPEEDNDASSSEVSVDEPAPNLLFVHKERYIRSMCTHLNRDGAYPPGYAVAKARELDHHFHQILQNPRTGRGWYRVAVVVTGLVLVSSFA